VIKMWEVEPRELLKYEGLLPLATLCRAESGEQLLTQVAEAANRIPSRQQRREVISASRVFAGLRYHKNLVNQILKETDMLEESVIYQDILQRGVRQGLQQGEQRGLQGGFPSRHAANWRNSASNRLKPWVGRWSNSRARKTSIAGCNSKRLKTELGFRTALQPGEAKMLEESVIYQDILQRGVQRGLQQGLQQGERRAALLQLEQRFGKLTPSVRQRIEQLALAELDALCKALLDFQSKQDLSRWLRQHAPSR
jgi:predicted transposase YdaD